MARDLLLSAAYVAVLVTLLGPGPRFAPVRRRRGPAGSPPEAGRPDVLDRGGTFPRNDPY